MEYFDKISLLIHVNIIYRLPCITVFFDGRGFAEHQLKIWDQLVKMLKTLELRGVFTSNFVYYVLLHCPATAMQNGDEASPSIILAGQALLVKMLITLEPRGKITSNFVYLCTLTLSSHCHAKRWRGFTEHDFGRSSSFSENAHNSWTLWYICFKFCILMYLNIVQPLLCKTVTRLRQASFWLVELSLVKMLITLEPHGIFASNFVSLCTLTLSDHYHAKRWRGFAEHHFGRSNWL